MSCSEFARLVHTVAKLNGGMSFLDALPELSEDEPAVHDDADVSGNLGAKSSTPKRPKAKRKVSYYFVPPCGF